MKPATCELFAFRRMDFTDARRVGAALPPPALELLLLLLPSSTMSAVAATPCVRKVSPRVAGTSDKYRRHLLGVLLDLQELLQLRRAVVLVEVRDHVDLDHLVPVVRQVRPVCQRQQNKSSTPSNQQVETRRAEAAHLLCSMKSGESLFKAQLCGEGMSMPSICQPSARLMAVCSASNSE